MMKVATSIMSSGASAAGKLVKSDGFKAVALGVIVGTILTTAINAIHHLCNRLPKAYRY